jgi:hypothetical protein
MGFSALRQIARLHATPCSLLVGWGSDLWVSKNRRPLFQKGIEPFARFLSRKNRLRAVGLRAAISAHQRSTSASRSASATTALISPICAGRRTEFELLDLPRCSALDGAEFDRAGDLELRQAPTAKLDDLIRRDAAFVGWLQFDECTGHLAPTLHSFQQVCNGGTLFMWADMIAVPRLGRAGIDDSTNACLRSPPPKGAGLSRE